MSKISLEIAVIGVTGHPEIICSNRRWRLQQNKTCPGKFAMTLSVQFRANVNKTFTLTQLT